MCIRVYVCMCVCACVRACMCACVCACVFAHLRPSDAVTQGRTCLSHLMGLAGP